MGTFKHIKLESPKRESTSTANKMSTTLINIDSYDKKFEEYPPDLREFVKEKNIILPPLTTMRGQALALMAQPEVRGQKHLTRVEADKFCQQLGMGTKDSIQQFNKATGLKRLGMKGKYCLQYPFEADTTDLDKRNGAHISGDRDTAINAIKAQFQKNIIDPPNELWQLGHLDPTIPDSSEKNLAWQPPIQGKFRDRFKWCPLFQRMWPTAKELIPKFNEYYTEAERKDMLAALKKEFEP
jgi:hypothetical protein